MEGSQCEHLKVGIRADTNASGLFDVFRMTQCVWLGLWFSMTGMEVCLSWVCGKVQYAKKKAELFALLMALSDVHGVSIMHTCRIGVVQGLQSGDVPRSRQLLERGGMSSCHSDGKMQCKMSNAEGAKHRLLGQNEDSVRELWNQEYSTLSHVLAQTAAQRLKRGDIILHVDSGIW